MDFTQNQQTMTTNLSILPLFLLQKNAMPIQFNWILKKKNVNKLVKYGSRKWDTQTNEYAVFIKINDKRDIFR